MGVMTQMRIWQAVFLIAAVVGFIAAANGETAGAVFGLVCLVLFFVCVAIVGWVKAGVSRRRG
jgi:hypothetical protein